MNKELILKAIESAKCRVYKLNFDLNGNISAHHQKKAENQKEMMEVTVAALEKQLPVKPVRVVYAPVNNPARKRSMFYCGACGKVKKRVYKDDRYCSECGTLIDWSEEHGKY